MPNVDSHLCRGRHITLCVGAEPILTVDRMLPLAGSDMLTMVCCSGVNHGTFLHIAHEEGLIRNTSIHAGIRAPVLRRRGDVRNDVRCGFEIVRARDIDRIGTDGVIRKLKERVGGSKVYISVDIDVLDPAFAPGMFASRGLRESTCALSPQHVEELKAGLGRGKPVAD